MAIGRVLVCDDSDGTREEFVARINATFGSAVAENHTGHDLKQAIAKLLLGESGTLFDGADVAVIDNRLIDDWVEPDDPKVSAEQLADLVRTSSTARSVVVLNQYREIDFDLRLDGRLESYADLNITEKCLECGNLWTESRPAGFRPWSWPVMERLVDQLDRRREWLMSDGRLDSPVIATLGLGDERIFRGFSRVATDFLHATLPPEQTTFRDFVMGATRSTDGKRKNDLDDDRIAKIAASRLGKWLEHAVLGPQDLLVDIPHLLERFPILVSDPTSLDSWNAPISWSRIEGFRSDQVSAYEWPMWKDWLNRPAYLWPLLQDDENLSRQMIESIDKQPPLEVGFCEDMSKFLAVSETQEFVANFDSAFDRRRLSKARPEGFVYGPASRLAR